MTTHILLADNRSRVRFALRALLEEESGLRVVGEASSAQDLLAQAGAACPDLVLLSWELPGLAETKLLFTLRTICPRLSLIVLSGSREVERAALAAGADAFVSKGTTPEHVLAAIAACQKPNRRWMMTEGAQERKNRSVYTAITAVALVALAAVAACLVVSLTLISEIPFNHIFPH